VSALGSTVLSMALLISGNRSVRMGGFRFGILDGIVNSRWSPTVLARASYLTAAATGADSFWVGDHLNALLPRSIATPEYFGVAAKLVPNVDAVLEPWTMLGHLAARNRVRRLRLGVCVTDASRRRVWRQVRHT
jgi:phthiodiolone/phenolphthiodiolone dimycocerosates ketoreductase